MRDRLIELIQKSVGGCARNWAETISDYLLANGVIVPPCKVGDTVYYIPLFENHIIECIVAQIAKVPFTESEMSFCCYGGFSFDMRSWDKTVFLTREEAEKALKEREGI